MNRFLETVCGEHYRDELDRLVPGAFTEAMAHAELYFRIELDAVANWRFGPNDAAHIDLPVLNVVGTDSAPRFRYGAGLIRTWLPHALDYVLPGTGHLMMAQNPTAMAERLEQFWAVA